MPLCVYPCVCNVFMYVRMNITTNNDEYMHACVHTVIQTYIHILYIYIYIYIYIYKHMHIYVCACVCTYKYVDYECVLVVCINVCVY
jgi:hypothetical protein